MMGLGLQTITYCSYFSIIQVSLPQGTAKSEAVLNKFVHDALRLQVEQTPDLENPKVTISFHEVTAPKQQGLSKEKFIICAIGEHTNLQLPKKVAYHDPRHMWACVSWSTDSSSIKGRIKQFWPADWPESRQLTEHMLYYVCNNESSGSANEHDPTHEPTQLLDIDKDKPDARFSIDNKDKHHIEMWSHERKPNSLVDLIMRDHNLRKQLLDGREELVSAITARLRQHHQNQQRGRRPTVGFQIPSIQLCHCNRTTCGNNPNMLQHDVEVLDLGNDCTTHLVFSKPQPSGVIRRLCANKDLLHKIKRLLHDKSAWAKDIINSYIRDHRGKLPNSFRLPTMQLQLKKLAIPNHLGAEKSPASEEQQEDSKQSKPYALSAANHNDAHILFAKPQPIYLEQPDVTTQEA